MDSNSFYRDNGLPPIGERLAVRRAEAARLLGISVPTLDRRVKAGEIPAVKLRGAVMFFPSMRFGKCCRAVTPTGRPADCSEEPKANCVR
jgi:excisionase family DNA binding protein